MNSFGKSLVGAAMALCALGAASGAAASQVLVSDVSVYNWNTANIAGHGNEVSTGIVFNNAFLVFCVDIQHNINVTHYDPSLVFEEGYLEYDGAGNAISEATPNRIGQLADLGAYYRATNIADLGNKLSAIQAAIWSIEYNTPVTFAGVSPSLGYLDAQVAQLLTVTDNGRGRARALIAHGPGLAGVQNMTTGGVPEPATWTMMIFGFGLAGAMLRRRQTVFG